VIKKKRGRRSTQTKIYRSKLEQRVSLELPSTVRNNYETHHLTYTVDHKYCPDWSIDDKTFIEAKGYFRASDRAKHLYIREQYPDVTVMFVFGDAKNKIHKNSKTTYADWCEKYGFKYTDIKQGIPKEWFT
jgi:hypothetical protein